jgi:phosphopantothenoylcysteine decarboxylase/phosphopantothenate--cysteine ligase
MGVELALNFANKGAKVNLVLGPSSIQVKHSNITVHRVESASEMYTQAMTYFNDSTIAIAAAAVADYTPTVVSEMKIKKEEGTPTFELKKTKDILAGWMRKGGSI